MSEDNKDLEQFEEIANDYLDSIRELEYTVFHFMKKTNKSTALSARNAQRDVARLGKEFKDLSIHYFNG